MENKNAATVSNALGNTDTTKIDGLTKGPKGTLSRQEAAWLAIGQVIGAGVIALIGPAMAATGTSVWLAYAAAVFLGFFLSFPFMVISGTVRLSGGTYSAVYSIVGKRAGGIYLIGSIPAMIGLASYPIAAAGYIQSLLPGINTTLVALGLLLLFYIINLIGVDFMAKVQTVLGYCLILGLISFVIFALPKVNWSQISFSSGNFLTNGFSGFMTAVFILIYSTHGYYWVIGYSNVTKNARKAIPFAMKISIPIILVLYVGCGIVAASVLPFEEVVGQPLTYVAKEALPTAIFWLFYLGGALGALLTSLNSTYGYWTNMFAGGANDGWLPKVFTKKNKMDAYWVILTIGFLIGCLPVIFKFNVATVTNNTLFVQNVVMLLGFVAAWKLPDKYPQLWERSTMKMSKTAFRCMMVLCFIVEITSIIYAAKGSNLVAVIISAVAIIFSVVYSNIAYKSGKVSSDASVWYD
ncbi:APC family permease [Blautia producta]|uniref:APC family permease n=1 Tax=Blautia producta TaxID=33035 RepID=UPI0031B5DF70